MRSQWAVYLVAALASQGCGPLYHVARTSVVEPGQYPRRLDDHIDKCHNEQAAEEAWWKFQEEDPALVYSHDFYLGFIKGYSEYLYAGGTGAPPPLPPRWYWRSENESPEGRQAILDWFAGYRKGAALARHSGYRELVTVPVSSPPPGLSAPMVQAPRAGPSIDPTTQTLPQPKPILPAPREIPPEPQPKPILPAPPGIPPEPQPKPTLPAPREIPPEPKN